MKKVIIIALLLAIIFGSVLWFRHEKTSKFVNLIPDLESNPKLFKIENYTTEVGDSKRPKLEIFIDFDNKTLYYIKIFHTVNGESFYDYKEEAISDEDLKIYREIENYKEPYNEQIDKFAPGGRWEIGYLDNYRMVFELPAKTELLKSATLSEETVTSGTIDVPEVLTEEE